MRLVALGVVAAHLVTPAARAEAPPEAARLIAPAPGIRQRLAAHRIRADQDVVEVIDIAGDGRPWIGVVERRGDALWLVTAVTPLRLTGALARPRLAGPGYLVWAQGRRVGDAMHLTRLGVLAPPPR